MHYSSNICIKRKLFSCLTSGTTNVPIFSFYIIKLKIFPESVSFNNFTIIYLFIAKERIATRHKKSAKTTDFLLIGESKKMSAEMTNMLFFGTIFIA